VSLAPWSGRIIWFDVGGSVLAVGFSDI